MKNSHKRPLGLQKSGLFMGASIRAKLCSRGLYNIKVKFFSAVLDQAKTDTQSVCVFSFPLILTEPKANCISNQSLAMQGPPVRSFSAVEFINTRNQGQHLGELSASPRQLAMSAAAISEHGNTQSCTQTCWQACNATLLILDFM